MVTPFWRRQRKAASALWWKLGGRGLTTRQDGAQDWPLRYPTFGPCPRLVVLEKDLIRRMTFSHMPNDSISANKELWITESNALPKSKYTMSAVFPSSINRIIVSSTVRELEGHDRWGRTPCWRPAIALYSLRNFKIPSKTSHTTEVRLTEWWLATSSQHVEIIYLFKDWEGAECPLRPFRGVIIDSF